MILLKMLRYYSYIFEIVRRFKTLSHQKNLLLIMFYELIYNTEIPILQKGKCFT